MTISGGLAGSTGIPNWALTATNREPGRPLRLSFAIQALIGIRVTGDLDEAAVVVTDPLRLGSAGTTVRRRRGLRRDRWRTWRDEFTDLQTLKLDLG